MPRTAFCRGCGLKLLVGDNWTRGAERGRNYLCRSCISAGDRARRLAIKAAERCAHHPGRPASPGKTVCNDCLRREKERYQTAKAAGRCPAHPDVPSAPGRFVCQQCLDVRAATAATRAAAGRCAGHRGQSVAPGRTMCQKCLDLMAARNLLRCYGLTPTDFAAKLRAQGGLCAAPGCTDKPTCLDHDHSLDPKDPAGHRGLLCNRHNLVQGYAEAAAGREPDAQARWLRSLARYLDLAKHHPNALPPAEGEP